jgi:hypothetical protein
MRMMSLLITVLVVAYVVYAQMGGGAPAGQSRTEQVEAKAATVNDQVQDQFSKHEDAISRQERGESSAPAYTSAP